jgi:hypothetical protein
MIDNYTEYKNQLQMIDTSSNLQDPSMFKYTEKLNISGFFNKKTLSKLGIFCGIFFIWSLVVVFIFHPKYITNEENLFSWSKYLTTSIIILVSMIVLFYFTKWLIKYLNLD